MNKLVIPNGGMPLHGDDFNFIDAAVRDAFKGSLYELAMANGGNMILGGCAFSETLTVATIAEGYVMLNYEIMYVPAQVYAKTSLYTFLVPAVSFDPAGSEIFANSTTQDTYQIRRATLGSLPGVGVPRVDMSASTGVPAPTLSSTIYETLLDKVSESSSLSFFNGWSNAIANPLRLFRHFRQANLVGDVALGTISGVSFTQIALIIPEGFRPAKRLKVTCAAFGVGVFGSVMIEVMADGEIYAIATDSNTYDLVSINISYIAQ